MRTRMMRSDEGGSVAPGGCSERRDVVASTGSSPAHLRVQQQPAGASAETTPWWVSPQCGRGGASYSLQGCLGVTQGQGGLKSLAHCSSLTARPEAWDQGATGRAPPRLRSEVPALFLGLHDFTGVLSAPARCVEGCAGRGGWKNLREGQEQQASLGVPAGWPQAQGFGTTGEMAAHRATTREQACLFVGVWGWSRQPDGRRRAQRATRLRAASHGGRHAGIACVVAAAQRPQQLSRGSSLTRRRRAAHRAVWQGWERTSRDDDVGMGERRDATRRSRQCTCHDTRKHARAEHTPHTSSTAHSAQSGPTTDALGGRTRGGSRSGSERA